MDGGCTEWGARGIEEVVGVREENQIGYLKCASMTWHIVKILKTTKNSSFADIAAFLPKHTL